MLFLIRPMRLGWRFGLWLAVTGAVFFFLQTRLFQLGRQLRITLRCLLSLCFLCAGSGVGGVNHRPARAGLLAVAVATLVGSLRPSRYRKKG